jgi:glyoxylase-like metal-dependent hydrolase (beta-lactamase superfamily II)
MKKIKNNIYTESSYPGVTVGAFVFPRGTLLIDAPLRPEDSQHWLSQLNEVGAKAPRIMVNLDSHPDRSLGGQSLHSQLITHENSAEHLEQRAAIFKSLKQETGAEWENMDDISSLRWVMPNLVFSKKTKINLGDGEAKFELHEGPSPGASWLLIEAQKVVFIGDTVVKKEPPFMAYADIDAWVASLDLLLSKEYKGYRIISSRGGEVSVADIRDQRRFLIDVEGRLQRLGKRKAAQSEVIKIAEKLFEKYKYSAKSKKKYLKRLRHGLQTYYARKYFPSSKSLL